MNVIVRCCGGLTLVLTAAGCSLTPVAPAEPPAPPVSASSTAVELPTPAPSLVAPVSRPTTAGFSYQDPGPVCQRFAAALYSADTTRDSDAAGAWQRAAAYMSGVLAAQSAAAARDGRWQLWQQHQVHLDTSTLLLDPDPETADTPTEAARTVRVTATPVGADGWRGPTEDSRLLCELARTDAHAAWRVADFRIEPAGPR
ncbi:hypothetical protein [Actinoplanes regularis]|uniref:hypothetical protein n=1 Tax=Actinoplanes regularis TaxID=52697 RepID=UPI0024A3382E|nr:hypothetical protein [Actinoplanes regularis]GLW34469.1 hypothetical protein Areg01_74060 [Actinoplanes regularis]